MSWQQIFHKDHGPTLQLGQLLCAMARLLAVEHTMEQELPTQNVKLLIRLANLQKVQLCIAHLSRAIIMAELHHVPHE